MHAPIDEERCPSGVLSSLTISHASARSSPTRTSRLALALLRIDVVLELALLRIDVVFALMLLFVVVVFALLLAMIAAVLPLLLVTMLLVLVVIAPVIVVVLVLLLVRIDVRLVLAFDRIVERASARSPWICPRRSYEASDLAPPSSPAHHERTAKMPCAMSSAMANGMQTAEPFSPRMSCVQTNVAAARMLLVTWAAMSES